MARARECVVEVSRCILQELSIGLNSERLQEFLSMLALTRICSIPSSLSGLRTAARARGQKTGRVATRKLMVAVSGPDHKLAPAHSEPPFHELYYIAEAALVVYCSKLGNLISQFNGTTCIYAR